MSVATLHYIHDPLCGWCYAAQPLVSAMQAQLGDRLALRLHGGGLFGEPRRVDAALAQHIVHSDERIAQLSGQPFGEAYKQGLLADEGTVLYSLPPIAAVLAAESLDAAKAYPMLAAIQNAHYQRGLRVVEPQVLTELAEEIGLDGTHFAQALARADGHTLFEHVQASRRLLDEAGGHGFPTLLLEVDGRRTLLPHHHYYGRPDAFVQMLAGQLPAVH
ncbi:DsbA family protein [Rhodanobacter sp. DHG33]|uniref:DsbA family protein n=1 Tax=Rhodanobacter sp. DHG33 TaxID=2775921 RepID=UPI00177E7A74|nr:DsbA family protein [Rhodanobacter sp. DHG33]MBD8898455.1 DsbA family protein [Rhodanobacter sp. DHG33]